MRNIKEKRGITLIALAVTIIVILILAGVTIDAVFSDDGIINKAKEAANAMNNAVANDQAELNDLLEELNEIMNSEWDSNIEIPDPEPPKLDDTTGMQDETIKVEDEYGNKVTIPKDSDTIYDRCVSGRGGSCLYNGRYTAIRFQADSAYKYMDLTFRIILYLK